MRAFLIQTLFICLLVACSSEDSTPTSPTDEFKQPTQTVIYNTVKIKFIEHDNGAYEFFLYKSKEPCGNKDWIQFDHFTITFKPEKQEVSKNIKMYSWDVLSTSLEIWVKYHVVVDFINRKVNVYSKGEVYQILKDVITELEEQSTFKEWKWNMVSKGLSIINKTEKNGYYYNETTSLWATICSPLPCGPWVTLPGYSEGHIYTNSKKWNISGPDRQIIIQLWKGFCPRFLDGHTFDSVWNVNTTNKELYPIIESAKAIHELSHFLNLDRYNLLPYVDAFPGGFGAEVGIYEPITGINDQLFWKPIELGSGTTSGIKIKFNLVNPKISGNNNILVAAEEKDTWWRTKWMSTDSYLNKYVKNYPYPDDPLEYELHFWINGVQGVWKSSKWPGGKIVLPA